MKFFKLLSNENNLKSAYKKSLLLKRDSKADVFFVNIPTVLGTRFFVERLQWLLLNYVSVSEKNFKKRRERDCLCFN